MYKGLAAARARVFATRTGVDVANIRVVVAILSIGVAYESVFATPITMGIANTEIDVA